MMAMSVERGRPRRRSLDQAKRELRVSLAEVDNATAHKLIEHHRPIVNTIVHRYASSAQQAFHVLLREDLVTIGETAVLEAYVRYRDGDPSKDNAGGGFATWARRVVGWRVSEAVQRALTQEPHVNNRADSANGVLRAHRASNPRPDTVAYRRQLMAWLRRRLRRLSPRQRIIISAVLKGESQAAVARSLGLSPGRVNQEYFHALEQLRQFAAEDGFDGVDLGS